MDSIDVDCEPIPRNAVSQLFADTGVVVRPADGQPFLGTGKDYLLEGVTGEYGVTLNLSQDLAHVPPEVWE